MGIIFRWLFKKVKPIYIVPILIVVGFLSIYVFPAFMSSNILIKAEYPLDKSENPEASKHFINAMEYKIKIGNLHKFIDYDNPLMKPFLNDLYMEYEKGKALLPENSAEDVYWYVILFRGIHGIGGIPDKYDMSLSYKTTLSEDEYKQHYKNILKKIRRLAINDFNFDASRITKYKYEFMTNLIDESFSILSKYAFTEKNFYLNKNYLNNMYNIYTYYLKFSNTYLPLANKQNKNIVRDIYIRIRILSTILFLKLKQTRKANCEDTKFKKLLKNIKTLKQMSLSSKYKNQTSYYKRIFKNGVWIYEILRISKKYCPKLRNDSIMVLKYFDQNLKI